MKRFLYGFVVLAALGILLFWGAAAEADFTIMPLGDSITYGLPVPGGYRTRLYSDLHDAGYSFTFVGTTVDNASRLLSQVGQTHHEAIPAIGSTRLRTTSTGRIDRMETTAASGSTSLRRRT